MELFLETLALVFKIICRLRVLGKPALLRLFAQLHERRRALLRELFLPGEDIHRQLLEVFEVLLIHLVHDRDVLHERELVLVQLGSNFIDVCLRLAVLCLHLLRAHLRLAEKTRDALLFRFVHALELDDKARHHVADFAKVARLDLGERRLRKIGNVLLRRRTVLQHLRRVGQIDLLGKRQHRLLLRRAQHRKIRSCLGRLFRLFDQILFLDRL